MAQEIFDTCIGVGILFILGYFSFYNLIKTGKAQIFKYSYVILIQILTYINQGLTIYCSFMYIFFTYIGSKQIEGQHIIYSQVIKCPISITLIKAVLLVWCLQLIWAFIIADTFDNTSVIYSMIFINVSEVIVIVFSTLLSISAGMWQYQLV